MPTLRTSPAPVRRPIARLAFAATLLLASSPPPVALERVSVSSAGVEADDSSFGPSISATGRFVSFESLAANLVEGDDNAASDVFLRDRKTGVTTTMSLAANGEQGDGASLEARISPNGRYVAFMSHAPDLVEADANGFGDIFVRDRKKGTTARVSVTSDALESDQNSFFPALTTNARLVVFESSATNLVEADVNAVNDVFMHDRKTGETSRVSVGPAGEEGDASSFDAGISANGRYVVFSSGAANFAEGDRNGTTDVFVRDRKKAATTCVSVSSAGELADDQSFAPSISRSGRFVAFRSAATNLVEGDRNGVSDVFVRDRKAGTTTLVSVSSEGTIGDAASFGPAISANGRLTVFISDSVNLVTDDLNGERDVFRHDSKTGVTILVSASTDGLQGDEASSTPAISAKGRFVAFESDAENFVAVDENEAKDIFVRDLK